MPLLRTCSSNEQVDAGSSPRKGLLWLPVETSSVTTRICPYLDLLVRVPARPAQAVDKTYAKPANPSSEHGRGQVHLAHVNHSIARWPPWAAPDRVLSHSTALRLAHCSTPLQLRPFRYLHSWGSWSALPMYSVAAVQHWPLQVVQAQGQITFLFCLLKGAQETWCPSACNQCQMHPFYCSH